MQRNSGAVGIDLGTTNSCVGVVRNGRVEIIANDQGRRITPSFVAFTESERLIGDAAKQQAAWNPKNSIYDVKRLIGRKFTDPDVQKLITQWPFNVIKNNNNDAPKISVTFEEREKQFTPEEISSMVLMKMKEVAETHLGHEVKDAVITVPAYFNDSQRQATIDAGTIAGLNILSILDEPTAAVLANKTEEANPMNILIYDLGGGSCDVTVMKYADGKHSVSATETDACFNGRTFDAILVEHFVKEIARKNKNVVLCDRSLSDLTDQCKKVKHMLSFSATARLQIELSQENVSLSTTLSRARFENLCDGAVKKSLDLVSSVLKAANLEENCVDQIILTGGCSTIPLIEKRIQEIFSSKSITKLQNPDEIIASGAALFASGFMQDLKGEKFKTEELLKKQISENNKTMLIAATSEKSRQISEVIRNTNTFSNCSSSQASQKQSMQPHSKVYVFLL